MSKLKVAKPIWRAGWMVALALALAPGARADASLGSWSLLPSMSTPRYGAAGAALSDGRVLVAGGLDGSGTATASAEVYDPTTGAWAAVPSMGSARAFAAAAPLPGDRALVVGGDVAGLPSASAEIYDGTSNTWSPAPSMSYARAGASAVALPGGQIWVMAGADEDSEIYNPASGSWSASVWAGGMVGGVAAPVNGGEAFIAGGYEPDSSSLFSWSALLSPLDTNGWGAYPMSEPPYQAAATPLSGYDILMVGGSMTEANPSPSASAATYDVTKSPSSSAWSPVASMETPRYGAVAAPLPDGRVLVAGGEGGSGPLASAEAFTPPVPVDVTSPVIVDRDAATPGTVRMGDMITVSPGAWNGADGYEYDWQRCFATCVDVYQAPILPGATYIVSAADVGATLRVIVSALGADGRQAPATSNEIGPVAAPGFHLGGPETDVYPRLWRGDLTYLWVPVYRDDTTGAGQVGYRVWDPNAGPYALFTPYSGTLQFAPGQASSLIVVSVKDNGVPIMPASLEVALSGGSPLGLVAPSELSFPLTGDPSLYLRQALNPLNLAAAPPAGNPLGGAHFFADYFQSLPARQALAWAANDPWAAAKVAVIAAEPNTERFGAWNGQYPGWNVATYLDRAAQEEPGTVPMISTYRIVNGHCGHWSDPLSEQVAYHAWIRSLAEGIGTHPAVLFLEMDSLITAGCLSPQGVAVRMNELRDAIDVLSNDPHLVTYLDAGAADASSASSTASLLRRAGVSKIQGFFLNSTHFDWTKKEIAYGEKISRLTGGKHFVINTAENGQGPLRSRHPATQGNEVLCNPPGRGLGPLPTSHTGYRKVDAFAWIANPGVSGGLCQPGAPPSGVFWPELALQLVRHENFRVR